MKRPSDIDPKVQVEAYPRTEDESLFRQSWELPVLVRDIVPFYMRDLVCTCEGSHAHELNRMVHDKPIYVCSKCKKYVRWIQRICMNCDVRFVLTFSHPRYVTMWPTCWDCTQDTSYDPWYEMAKKFSESYIATSYRQGAYDNWPGSATPIVEPLPEDLIKKEPVTELVLDEIDLSFEDDVIF